MISIFCTNGFPRFGRILVGYFEHYAVYDHSVLFFDQAILLPGEQPLQF